MSEFDENSIDALRRHCRMYLYGTTGGMESIGNEVAHDFVIFAMLHLTCTMFITTDPPSPVNGMFHKVLDPMGKSHFLTDIDRLLDSAVGNTTLRQFYRSKRNKLATHGNLAYSSQPSEVRDVAFNEATLEQYRELMVELEAAVSRLDDELAKLSSEC